MKQKQSGMVSVSAAYRSIKFFKKKNIRVDFSFRENTVDATFRGENRTLHDGGYGYICSKEEAQYAIGVWRTFFNFFFRHGYQVSTLVTSYSPESLITDPIAGPFLHLRYKTSYPPSTEPFHQQKIFESRWLHVLLTEATFDHTLEFLEQHGDFIYLNPSHMQGSSVLYVGDDGIPHGLIGLHSLINVRMKYVPQRQS